MMEKIPLTHIHGIEIFRRWIGVLPKNKEMLARSRALRKGYILSEVLFWKQVRDGNFYGIDFDRKRIIGNYIVDFYVKSLGVIVQIEGTNHELKDIYDARREEYLKDLNLRMIKFHDSQIKNDIGGVLKEMEDYFISNFS